MSGCLHTPLNVPYKTVLLFEGVNINPQRIGYDRVIVQAVAIIYSNNRLVRKKKSYNWTSWTCNVYKRPRFHRTPSSWEQMERRFAVAPNIWKYYRHRIWAHSCSLGNLDSFVYSGEMWLSDPEHDIWITKWLLRIQIVYFTEVTVKFNQVWCYRKVTIEAVQIMLPF